MKGKKEKYSSTGPKKKVKKSGSQEYVLRLYVAGMTPRSKTAIVNIKAMCEDHLKGRYDLEVVDIMKNPVLATGEQIIATPTLIRRIPAPLQRFIGDLSEAERILVGVDLRKKS